MTTTNKVIPEFKPVKKLSPFMADPHNTRGGGKGLKKGVVASSAPAGVKKSNVASNLKKGGSGDR